MPGCTIPFRGSLKMPTSASTIPIEEANPIPLYHSCTYIYIYIHTANSPFDLPLLIIVIINYRCSQSLQMFV